MSLLTLHRPNFCAECGAKILRLRWRVWTSRRFCDSCASRLRKYRISAAALFITGLLCAFVLGRSMRRPPPPLILERKEIVASTNGSAANGGDQPVMTVEEIYTCGARTKKGTPCSRRVHGPVRCWQHKGTKPMVPQEKLLIK